MNILMKRLANLLTVKSIVTILLTLVFAALALKGTVSGQDVMSMLSVIIAFYFGSQSQRVSDAIDKVSEEDAAQ